MKKYFIALVSVLCLSAILISGLAYSSSLYYQAVDNDYELLSQESNSSILYPQITGSAMGLDHVYNLEDKVTGSTTKSIVNFGNSTTTLGVIDAEIENILDYQYVDAAYGSATLPGYFVMDNFLTEIGYETNNETIIKIDISPALFKTRNLNQDILVSALEYADVYKVTDTYDVVAQPLSSIRNYFGRSSHDIDKALEYAFAYFNTGYTTMYETNSYSFTSYHKDMKITEQNIALLESFIERFGDEQVIVEISYMHSTLYNSEAGVMFNEYVEKSLLPYLEEHNIPYLDARTVMDDSYYIDSTHLTYEGRIYYTEWVSSRLETIL